MKNNIINSLKNKNVAILGFGVEGKSTYKYIRKYLPNQKLYILDGNEKLLEQNPDLVNDYVEIIIGPNYLNNLEMFDVIIKSPGIVLNERDKLAEKITSQMSLVLEETDTFMIGITGTKGKSTTASLIYDVLKDQNIDVILAGNIGLPILDYVDEIKENTIVVAEFSSYQLEYLKKSPRIGIILNLYEEHLDHHKTLENYYNSKLNMFKYQTNNDYALYFKDNDILNKFVSENKYNSQLITVSFKEQGGIYCDYQNIYSNEEKLYDINSKRNLIGMHNINNIMFAFAVSKLLNLDIKKTAESVNKFKPLKHRLECIGTYQDIIFYDDAIATIPEACLNAIKSIGNIDTLIIGGMDRGISYDGFALELLKTNVNNFICLPDTGIKISKELEEMDTDKKIYKVEELDEAVEIAFNVTRKGMGCLLSPAAPSYNKYKNFAAKGEHFVELIKNYK